METGIQIFSNEEFGTIRTILIDGEPWFVGRDIAEILGYSNTRDALAKHVDDEDKIILNAKTLAEMASESKGRVSPTFDFEFDSPRGLMFINESGVYSLIFNSKLPKAKEFKHYVTSEVLPSIRKYGYYAVPSLETAMKNIAQGLTTDSAELACLTARMPVISLQIEAMMERILADYKKNPQSLAPIIEDLPGEIWKWIKNYEGFYQASTKGRVRSFFRGNCRIIIPTPSHRGYLGVCLYKLNDNGKMTKKTFRLNRVIAETFIPNPENKPEVHHKDTDKTNNAVDNLEWVTDEENKDYAHQDGVYLKGEKNPTAKLTEKDVRFIRQNYKAGDLEFGNIALAAKFKVSDVTITNIVTFKAWKHIQ